MGGDGPDAVPFGVRVSPLVTPFLNPPPSALHSAPRKLVSGLHPDVGNGIILGHLPDPHHHKRRPQFLRAGEGLIY